MAHQSSDNGDDEVWDLAGEDVQEADLHREWTSREAHFHTLGYRDGIEEGKKLSVQQGFEVGYTEGVSAGLNCGLARGWAGAFTALPHAIQNLLLDDAARMQVDESQVALSSISSEKAVYLFYHNISRIDDLKDKADMNANDTVVEDRVKQDITASKSRVDLSSVNVEKLHMELQSIMKSSGIIQ